MESRSFRIRTMTRGESSFHVAPEFAERDFESLSKLKGDADAHLNFSQFNRAYIGAMDACFCGKCFLRKFEALAPGSDRQSEELVGFLHKGLACARANDYATDDL